MKNILITGCAGFIGSNLASFLLKKGYAVRGIDNLHAGLKSQVDPTVEFHEMDIRDEKIYSLFKDIDVVFHLAAKNCLNDCLLDPVETSKVNVTGTVNVLEASKRANVKKFIYADSSAVYEESNVYPTPIEEISPMSIYAHSKRSGYLFCKAYQKNFNLNVTATRYFCVYGPAQDYRRTIPPLMSAFIIKILKGESPVIYGSGKKRRDFIYVDDVNDFHLKCINDPRTDNKTFNLGSGKNYSVLEIYELVSELLGKRIDKIFKPELSGEAEITLADITETKKLGWHPKTDIKTGLIKAIEYIRNDMAAGKV